MKSVMSAVVLIAAVWSPAALADSLQFTLSPSSGNVVGPAGTTVGWGYSITNESSSDWLLTTDLGADSFLNGTPNLLFDFPTIAPGHTVTEAFDATGGSGLYSLLWEANAPAGFSNTGSFVLTAQWFDGDPLNGGSFIANAIDSIAPYSATVAGSPTLTPEPADAGILSMAGLMFILIRRNIRKRQTRWQSQA